MDKIIHSASDKTDNHPLIYQNLQEEDLDIQLLSVALSEAKLLPNGIERWQKQMEVVRGVMWKNAENLACEVVLDVFNSMPWENQSLEEKKIFKEALETIQELKQSDNEYIWEICSQALANYFE